jgi:hypothetical protein
VDAELSGYTDRSAVPDYRIIRPPLYGDFAGPFQSGYNNVKLATDGLPKEVKDIVENFHFVDNIASIESLLAADAAFLHMPWDHTLVELLRRCPGVRIPGYVLNTAESLIPKAAVHGVLHAIRARLLGFLIDLQEQYPELAQSEDAFSQVPPERVTDTFDRIVYNYHACSFQETKTVTKHSVNIGGSVQTGRNFVVADAITGSFNDINASPADDEVKRLLTKLGDAVVQMCQELPEANQKQAAEDFQALAVEATKPAPRKGIIAAIGDGLKETAKVALQYSAPVIALVDALVKHFSQ